jgi:multiple sugar transport system permease protein
MTNARRETWVALGFLAPNLIGFVLLSLGPIVFSLIISLTDWGGLKVPSFIGVDNYLRLLNDPIFLRAARNTLLFTAMFVPLALVSAVALALLFDRKVRGTSVVRLLCFMPIITDMISVSFIWTWIYHLRFGVLNYVLGLVGIPPQAWLGDARWALFSLVVLSVWRWAGYYAVIILAALQGVPTPLQEAARIDGAGSWQVFGRITLPLITPAIFFVVVNSIISSLQVFEQMFVMTKGGPSDSTISIAMFLYQQGFLFLRMGYASSVAWVMFIGIFAFTFINWLLRRRWVYEE